MELPSFGLLTLLVVVQFAGKHALVLRNGTSGNSKRAHTNMSHSMQKSNITCGDERLNDDWQTRFDLTIADPANMKIPRCRHAGKLVQNGEVVVMFNGIVVTTYGYYGGFSRILQLNAGVHEAGEELLWGEIINRMSPGATVVEFGSYWAYYSVWFARAVPNARVFAIEAVAQNMQVGQENARLNGVEGKIDWTTGFVDTGFWATFSATKGISEVDAMLVDIQGFEMKLVPDLVNAISRGALKVKYIVIGTHGQDIHLACLRWIRQAGLRVVASSDHFQTFFVDGVIVATTVSEAEGGIPFTALGSRQTSPTWGAPKARPNPALPCKFLPDKYSNMLR